jgi:hypothetical protein
MQSLPEYAVINRKAHPAQHLCRHSMNG